MNKLALYGSDFYSKISKDLRAELPDVKSFKDEHIQLGGAGITVIELY